MRNREAIEAKNQNFGTREKKKKKLEKFMKGFLKKKKKKKTESSNISKVVGFTRRIPDDFRCCCNLFFEEIMDDVHDFVSECVSFPRKIKNPLWDLTVFQRKVTFSFRRETKTHKLRAKILELFFFLPRSPSNNSIFCNN